MSGDCAPCSRRSTATTSTPPPARSTPCWTSCAQARSSRSTTASPGTCTSTAATTTSPTAGPGRSRPRSPPSWAASTPTGSVSARRPSATGGTSTCPATAPAGSARRPARTGSRRPPIAPGPELLPERELICNHVIVETILEHAGGEDALRRFIEIFYAGVLADPLLQPLFGAGRPEHVDHLTAFEVEAFGGPGGPEPFTRTLGFQHLIDVHRGLRISEPQRARFVELYLA